jgi:hypothetical protein
VLGQATSPKFWIVGSTMAVPGVPLVMGTIKPWPKTVSPTATQVVALGQVTTPRPWVPGTTTGVPTTPLVISTKVLPLVARQVVALGQARPPRTPGTTWSVLAEPGVSGHSQRPGENEHQGPPETDRYCQLRGRFFMGTPSQLGGPPHDGYPSSAQQ